MTGRLDSQGHSHWNSIARQWKYFGPPLRPCCEDIRVMEKMVASHCEGMVEIRTRLCGITPEIASMRWPCGTILEAVERSQEMINAVWPGDIDAQRRAMRGEWLETTGRNNFQIVIGDGCFISMDFPAGYRALAKTLHDSLRTNGLMIMRFFVQETPHEAPQSVFADLAAGRIGSFHAFKWRLAMSLQETPHQGVRLHDIYAAWADARIDIAALIEQRGWSREAIRTIDLYRNKQNRFAFASHKDILATFSDIFTVADQHTPSYELGGRCPIIAFTPR